MEQPCRGVEDGIGMHSILGHSAKTSTFRGAGVPLPLIFPRLKGWVMDWFHVGEAVETADIARTDNGSTSIVIVRLSH